MIIILFLLIIISGSFIAGLALAGWYYRKLIAEWQYVTKILAADKGLGYIAPPENKPVLLSEEFMNVLRKNKRATQALRKNPT